MPILLLAVVLAATNPPPQPPTPAPATDPVPLCTVVQVPILGATGSESLTMTQCK